MDQETLFTGSKWDILKLLEQKQMSPLELSEKSGTSMANISQQLRFLELAGIVKSKRISNRDKGKPRILYSLSGNNSFLISVAPGFVNKRLHSLNERKKAILKLWFYKNREDQYFLEKAFMKLDKHLPEIEAVAVNEDEPLTLTIISANGLQKEIGTGVNIVNSLGTKKTVKYHVVRKEKLNGDKYYSIYDPQILFGG